MGKKVVKGTETRLALLKGVNIVVDAVKVTLGPKGKNVIYNNNVNDPVIVNDGISIAKTIELDDELENMGAQLVIQASNKTNEEVGDSSTLSCILTQAIVNEGMKNITAGANAVEVKKGMKLGAQLACDAITNLSKPVETIEEIKHVATISAGNDEAVGALITEAMEKVGTDGVITIGESKTTDTNLKVVEGMQFKSGFISHHFATDKEKGVAEYEDCYVLCADKILSKMEEMVPCLEAVAKAQKPLLIIAQDVQAELLATMVVNSLRGILKVVAVKAPEFGEYRTNALDDIAVMTGTTLVSEEIGTKLKDIKEVSDLGFANKVIVTKDNCTIVRNEKSVLLEERIQLLKAKIEADPKSTKLKERLARLNGGVAVIEVGAATEVELKEKKLRIEDALNASRVAIAEGIAEGGGVCLLKVQQALLGQEYEVKQHDVYIGIKSVVNALSAPIKQIAENAGVDGAVIINEIISGRANGYDALTDSYVDMVESGIVDPTKALRCAVLNATSVASMICTTESAVVTKKEEDKSNYSISTEPKMIFG